MTLTEADRTPAKDPAKPTIQQPLPPPAATGEEERKFLLGAVVKPVFDFSLAQEATTQAERQRANGVVAKVDAAKPKRRWQPFR